MKTFLSAVFLATALMTQPAQAGRFANQFSEFELPPNWNCQLEGAEWVCQNADESKKKEAIIVLAAKLKGDQDSLDQYLAYLKSVKSFTSVTGKPMKSEPRYAKTANINGHAWVDALHLESEIPGFYTRYLATVKDDIGVLITYSIAKDKYQDYLDDFENLVRTLKVFRKEGGINTLQAQNTQIGELPTTNVESAVFPGVNVQGAAENVGQSPNQGQPQEGMDLMSWIILIGAAAVVLIILKKKRG